MSAGSKESISALLLFPPVNAHTILDFCPDPKVATDFSTSRDKLFLKTPGHIIGIVSYFLFNKPISPCCWRNRSAHAVIMAPLKNTRVKLHVFLL